MAGWAQLFWLCCAHDQSITATHIPVVCAIGMQGWASVCRNVCTAQHMARCAAVPTTSREACTRAGGRGCAAVASRLEADHRASVLCVLLESLHFTSLHECRKPTVFNHAHQHHHRNLLTPHIIVCPIHAHRYTHLRDSATAHVRRDSMMCRTPSSRPPANLLHEAQLMTAWVPMRAISLRIYRQKMGKFATSCQSYL
jgi:hypothetical protein